MTAKPEGMAAQKRKSKTVARTKGRNSSVTTRHNNTRNGRTKTKKY